MQENLRVMWCDVICSFVPKYLKILAAGGSRKPEDLLKESGIDISKDEFWQKGFDFVAQKVQQLKEL